MCPPSWFSMASWMQFCRRDRYFSDLVIVSWPSVTRWLIAIPMFQHPFLKLSVPLASLKHVIREARNQRNRWGTRSTAATCWPIYSMPAPRAVGPVRQTTYPSLAGVSQWFIIISLASIGCTAAMFNECNINLSNKPIGLLCSPVPFFHFTKKGVDWSKLINWRICVHKISSHWHYLCQCHRHRHHSYLVSLLLSLAYRHQFLHYCPSRTSPPTSLPQGGTPHRYCVLYIPMRVPIRTCVLTYVSQTG